MDKVKLQTVYILKGKPKDMADAIATKNTSIFEKKEDQVVMSVETAENVFKDLWDAATKKEREWNQLIHFEDVGDEKWKSLPDKEQYINNLFK